MTVDEKVGQLNQASGIIMPGFVKDKPDEAIVQGKVGSILWLTILPKKSIVEAKARAGDYPASISKNVPPALLKRYFVRTGPGYRKKKQRQYDHQRYFLHIGALPRPVQNFSTSIETIAEFTTKTRSFLLLSAGKRRNPLWAGL